MITKTLVLGVMFQAISFSGVPAVIGDTVQSQPEVLIRLHNSDDVSPKLLADAKFTATRILATAGVRLRWASTRLTEQPAGVDEAIDLQFLPCAPEHSLSKALAEAFPFRTNGIRITVFFDRVSLLFPSHYAPDGFILGHVMAHEIGHVLLRMHNHSAAGLMKAHWTDHDFVQMRWKAMEFTPEATATIQRNLRSDRELLAQANR